MKLHLIRHGKAKRPFHGKDFDRPLAMKGTTQTIELGIYLDSKITTPPTVFCSSARRTVETFQNINSTTNWMQVTYIEELYLCSVKDFLQLIWRHEGASELVIVGHNFGITNLVAYFTDVDLEMRTGEYICIDFGSLLLSESSKSTGVICDRFRNPN